MITKSGVFAFHAPNIIVCGSMDSGKRIPVPEQLRKLKVFIVALFFGWVKLKFGVRGNFSLLISNLNSKMQHEFETLRKCHFSSLR